MNDVLGHFKARANCWNLKAQWCGFWTNAGLMTDIVRETAMRAEFPC
jgi:hypothetical protein